MLYAKRGASIGFYDSGTPSHAVCPNRLFLVSLLCIVHDGLFSKKMVKWQRVGPWTKSIDADWCGRPIQIIGPFTTHKYQVLQL